MRSVKRTRGHIKLVEIDSLQSAHTIECVQRSMASEKNVAGYSNSRFLVPYY